MPPKYYLPYLVKNPFVRLKYHLIDKRKPLPAAPEHVQIQTVSGCNGNCIFCPNHKTDRKIPMGPTMDWGLYRSIVDQCADWGVRRFSPYLMNEPMLDAELPERIKYISDRKKGEQFIKINSHGNLMHERMAKGLLDSGLDRLNFSVQGLDPANYQEVMGLPLQKTLDNIDRLLELKRAGGYAKPRIRVVMLVTKYIEPQLPKIQEYWGSRGVKINLNQIESRGGHGAIRTHEIATRELRHFDWCNRLFNQMYILYDGRCVMCCADWEQRGLMGDVSKEPLAKIWNGFKYGCFRERFLNGHLRGMICENCSKDAVGDGEDE